MNQAAAIRIKKMTAEHIKQAVQKIYLVSLAAPELIYPTKIAAPWGAVHQASISITTPILILAMHASPLFAFIAAMIDCTVNGAVCGFIMDSFNHK
jgi:hypothetical protein